MIHTGFMTTGTKKIPVPQNGFAIREIREREGLSVDELARAIDISGPHLRNIENENRAASTIHLFRISKKLNCRLASIRREIDDMDLPA